MHYAFLPCFSYVFYNSEAQFNALFKICNMRLCIMRISTVVTYVTSKETRRLPHDRLTLRRRAPDSDARGYNLFGSIYIPGCGYDLSIGQYALLSLIILLKPPICTTCRSPRPHITALPGSDQRTKENCRCENRFAKVQGRYRTPL